MSVGHEIDQHLVQLVRVGLQEGPLIGQLEAELDIVHLQEITQSLQGRCDDGIELDRHPRRGLLAG